VLRAVVGIGANLGDRVGTMRAAVGRIDAVARIDARSRVYETAPVGNVDQPPFLNAAVSVAWSSTPEALLSALLAVEASLGRERRERWAPRTLDLDVLWIDGVVVTSGPLEVPHPRLLERAFAVVPLLDVAPDAVDPRTGARILAPAYDATALRVTDFTL
jgi:2-amino-4-hydroxy-6-hydroxymethyldihydropteridine diphosphokinase